MKNEILYSNLTKLLNSLSIKNEQFNLFLIESKFNKLVLKWLNKNRNKNLNLILLNDKINLNYEKFILSEIAPKLTLLNDKIGVKDSFEINNFLTEFSVENEALLFKLISDKFPLNLLINHIEANLVKLSLNEQNNIENSIENEQYNEVMKEINKNDKFYSFLNFYNSSNLNNPTFKENKVFSHKKLIRKTYHDKQYKINFYFNENTKELEFYIVENYDLTDLNLDIHKIIDLNSIIEEFQKTL